MSGRWSRGSWQVALIGASLSAFSYGGCREGEPIDPDGRDREHDPLSGSRSAVEAQLREIAFKDVVASVGGVSAREAPAVLERWLSASGEEGSAMLQSWPRRADRTLDLDRPPVVATLVEGARTPGGKSSCGEVSVVFAGATGPALRLRLQIPGTSRTCRDTTRATRLHGAEAVAALRDAVAAERVALDEFPPAEPYAQLAR